MRYGFTIDEATRPAKKNSVKFEAVSDAEAYQFVVREIILVDGNQPLKAGTLYRDCGLWRTSLMTWRRGSGWSFQDAAHPDDGMIDKRAAPGA
jgi:hypothetical protein